ncbi:type I-U CRISPR-associated helicase/endonuclease Cas3 [Chloracidobacterium validum]|uniref:Type I-U CRISPR-associated helicase/endonuclease Cas3 n=1 Tax=Chloracidobacterium validum TaxID=2821543 RepID=A0ABX8B7T9_9BACT|nr:type I-U CRISPR-associated helicase/endonuclease Cas3 [Chloracidobacterium validum]QUW02749.1 type I-U CRISPR-associated helicase/endonuclease Cas3 [Chloracidobacterium validum]
MTNLTPGISFDCFNELYKELTGHEGACRWQYRLFTYLEAGCFPTDIELATGLGKTSIIALWVLALGHALKRNSTAVPRRLAYVVERRVVVDQASEFAEQVGERLEQAATYENHKLHQIAKVLKEAGCTSSVIEVSTLRGQRTLDKRWRDDPARPAIIVGTVDMIGSRLLFSAYGRVGPWGRALEAGLLGQDCLIVLDEAHLCSPFAVTLTAIERLVNKSLAPFAVVRMGAMMHPVQDLLRRTPGLPPEEPNGRRVFRLLDTNTLIDGRNWPDETTDQKVANRLNAVIEIEVKSLDPKKGVGVQLAEWAIAQLPNASGQSQNPSGAAIGIVVNTVAQARKCAKRLLKENHQVVTLTGSMRGWDRDQVVKSDDYKRFKSQRNRGAKYDKPIFLVATSCVEVGADIDCDLLGVEACAADSLIQRLGRVNRLGLNNNAKVLLVGNRPDPAAKDKTDPAANVFERLNKLLEELKKKVRPGQPVKCSPATFTALLRGNLNDEEWRKLFDVRVPPPALTCAVLDDLAMTSKHPNTGARPDVGRWLHGSVEDPSLYVELAWRKELDFVTSPDDAERLLAAFPIGARETARCPLYEAVNLLKAVRDRSLEDDALGARVLLIKRYGETTPFRLRDLPTDDGKLRAALYDATVVLPTSAGGYDDQFVTPNDKKLVRDIAEKAQPTTRAKRRRLWIDAGTVKATPDSGQQNSEVQKIPSDTDTENLLSEVQKVVNELLGSNDWQLVEAAGNGACGVVVARKLLREVEDAEDDDGSLGFNTDVLLTQHLHDARTKATELCRRLSLPLELSNTVIEAAGQHDLGKDRPWWQRAVGRTEKPAVAKSKHSRFNHHINKGYRHELGSVADLSDGKVSLPPGVNRELCLHLIAAHHGHARPGFGTESVGPVVISDSVSCVLNETPVRFAKLQAQYGWWTLAWLEALVKTADVLASVLPSCGDNGSSVSNILPATSNIQLTIDARNPGEYLAVCGLLEVISRYDANATSAWRRETVTLTSEYSAFADVCEIKTNVEEDEVVKELAKYLSSQADWQEATENDRSPLAQSSGVWCGALEFSLPHKLPILIDHWYEWAYVSKGRIVQSLGKKNGKSRWKFWAGRQEKTISKAINDNLIKKLNEDLEKKLKLQDIITLTSSGESPLKIDAFTTQSSIDRGISANEAKNRTVRPALELLAAIGISAFFPPRRKGDNAPDGVVGVQNKVFTYHTWSSHLPLALARLAARGVEVAPTRLVQYKATIGTLGRYKHLRLARPAGIAELPAGTAKLVDAGNDDESDDEDNDE